MRAKIQIISLVVYELERKKRFHLSNWDLSCFLLNAQVLARCDAAFPRLRSGQGCVPTKENFERGS